MKIALASREAELGREISQQEIADFVDIKQPSVNGWLSGKTKTLKGDTALKAAMFFNVNPNWLTYGRGSMKTPGKANEMEGVNLQVVDFESNSDYIQVRRSTIRLTAGHTGFAVESVDDAMAPIVFRKDWLEKRRYRAEKLLAVNVSGNSMYPGLSDGDTVTVNLDQVTPLDGEVFAVNFDGELIVKRLMRDAGQWWLHSDNPDQIRYPRKLCAGEGCIILGRVIHKQSECI